MLVLLSETDSLKAGAATLPIRFLMRILTTEARTWRGGYSKGFLEEVFEYSKYSEYSKLYFVDLPKDLAQVTELM